MLYQITAQYMNFWHCGLTYARLPWSCAMLFTKDLNMNVCVVNDVVNDTSSITKNCDIQLEGRDNPLSLLQYTLIRLK